MIAVVDRVTVIATLWHPEFWTKPEGKRPLGKGRHR